MLKHALITSSVVLSAAAFAAEQMPEAISYPFVYQLDEREKGLSDVHKVKLLEDGLPSLQARLDLIKKAQKTIDIEYFIYNTDQGGKLFTAALIEAAERDVKVRILVDKNITIFKLNHYIAHQLKKHGIEVRYYNDSKDAALVQYRTHRKFIIIDAEDEINGQEAITGGRNIGDEYFDMSPDFNFHDRDMWIKGPAVKAMKDTFDIFWNDDLTVKPEKVTFKTPPKYVPRKDDPHAFHRAYEREMHFYKMFKKKMDKAKEFTTITDEERKLFDVIESKTRKTLDGLKEYGCPEIIFASDHPGGRKFIKRLVPGSRQEFTDSVKAIRKVLDQKIVDLDESIIVDSPYLLSNKITKQLVSYLNEKEIDFTLYTNSLASTDAFYVAANFYTRHEFKQREGMNVHLHKGKFFGDAEVFDEEAKKAYWGTHSKTQIYDNEEVMIGTYNIDNRSNYYNAEMGIFCKGDQGFVDEVKKAIEFRVGNGMKLVNREEAIDNKTGESLDPLGDAPLSKIIMMKFFTPLSVLIKDLL